MNCISELSWDSQFFGLKVGRIQVHNLNLEELESSLDAAVQENYRLIYLFTKDTRQLPDELLERFGGKLVDHRLTFQGEIADLIRRTTATDPTSCEVIEYPQQPADEELLQLGVLAGHDSRFHTDRDIPHGKFIELFQRWVDRSTTREIADQVLVAKHGSGITAGLITLKIEGNRGVIGLVAVASEFQGQGFGTSLMSEAHHWMASRQVLNSIVVTQRKNTGACRLYRKTGYTLHEEEAVYHFWLSNAS